MGTISTYQSVWVASVILEVQLHKTNKTIF